MQIVRNSEFPTLEILCHFLYTVREKFYEYMFPVEIVLRPINIVTPKKYLYNIIKLNKKCLIKKK